jgi:DNA-directed RNA polymerase subunit delta
VSSVRDLDREVLVEMSMVDIVYALLKEEGNKEPRAYNDLLAEVVKLKRLSEEDKLDAMSHLYTEINIDGRFKGLGDNVWGLRSWYPVDQAEEIIITDLKKKPKKKKKKKPVDDDFDDLEGLDDDDDLDDLDELDDDIEDPDDDDDDDDEDVDDDAEEIDDADEDVDDVEEVDEDLDDQDDDSDEKN